MQPRCWIPVAILGALSFAMLASSQSRKSPVTHHFESSGISFEYSHPLELCKGGPSACAGCNGQATVVACMAYDKKIYAGYNVSEGPALSISILDGIRDEAKCLDFADDELESLPPEQFNGVTFKTALKSDAAMSHQYRTRMYRTFHNGHCYALELLIGTANVGVFDPAERPKEFTPADERRVVGNFTRMFKTLQLR